MKKTFIISVFALLCMMSGTAFADIDLSMGDSVTIGGTRVSCGLGADPRQESAIQKQCGQEDRYGECQFFNETTITGRHCAAGDVCGHENRYGECIYYNTTAACGDRSCSTAKVCGKTDRYGQCLYFNETVSCR